MGRKTELERNFLKEKGENALEVVTGRKDNSLVFRFQPVASSFLMSLPES